MAKRNRDVPISDRIAFWRQQRGLTLRALAEKSGLYASQLHRFEHGEQDPRESEIQAIASGLGLTVVEFYEAEAKAS